MGVFDRIIDQHGGSRTAAREYLASLGPGVGPQHFASVSLSATNLVGVNELVKKFEAIFGDLARREISRAMRIGGRVVLSAMRVNAPVDDGDLRRSLAVKQKTYGNGVAIAVIGPRVGRGAREKGQATGEHAHLTEFGTKERIQYSTGRRVGSVIGTHWMEKSFDQSEQAAFQAIKLALARAIAQSARRFRA